MSPAFRERAVRVRVPATSANLGPGFDTLGLALTLYDEVEVRVRGPAHSGALDVRVEGEGAGTVDRGEGNLVVRSLRAAFEAFGGQPPGLAVACVNRIPHGRGLGSSAAAIVAGVAAARALSVDQEAADQEAADQEARPEAGPKLRPAADDEVFELATTIEGHPDNVAACLAGGLTIAWFHDAVPRHARFDPVPSLVPVALVPDEALSTQEARQLLPESVPHRDAAANAGRAALLVAALTARPDLLLDATEDRLHQDYRAPAMPRTVDLVAKLRAAGVPAVVSGAGPTILALAQDRSADSLGIELGRGWHVHRLGVDRNGAYVQAVVS